MKKILFTLLGLIVATFLGAFITSLYIQRDQEIDFTQYLPKEFKVCDRVIDSTDNEYQRLRAWFKSNTYPWNAILVSFAPKYVYSSPTISINVGEQSVVVNYRVDNSWSQVIHDANTSKRRLG